MAFGWRRCLSPDAHAVSLDLLGKLAGTRIPMEALETTAQAAVVSLVSGMS